MIVSGNSITKEQARDIILSTGLDMLNLSRYIRSSDSADLLYKYNTVANKILLDSVILYHREIIDLIMDKLKILLNDLNLEFLYCTTLDRSYNDDWCRLDGTILTIKSIGSYPSVSDVLNEWKLIARTFPYLNLNVSMYEDVEKFSNDCGIFNINVNNGVAKLCKPDIHVHNSSLFNYLDRHCMNTMSMQCDKSYTNEIMQYLEVEIKRILDKL